MGPRRATAVVQKARYGRYLKRGQLCKRLVCPAPVKVAAVCFGALPKQRKAHARNAKIGQLTLENDFLEGALIKAGLLSAKR